MSTINISGIQISYIEKGFGDTLILLHGNPGSGKVWRKVIPNLSANYRVIAHDRQGFGHSDDSEDGNFSPYGYCVELLNLMSALGIDRAHICGLSFGGMVAQCFAANYPQYVKSLILVGTTADRTARNVQQTIQELHRDGWAKVAKRLTQSWFRAESNPDDIQEAYNIALQSSSRMRELTVRALEKFDVRNEISSINCPTLILVGNEDQTCPPGQSEEIRDLIKESSLIRISDCGHMIPVEQPEIFCAHISSFLSAQPRSSVLDV